MRSSLLRCCLLSLALLAAGCGPEAPGTSPDEALAAADSDALHGAADGGQAGVGKVAVCHVPPGNPANAHTIVVGEPALSAHVRHGDPLGACGTGDAGTGDGGEGSGDGGVCRPEGASCDAASPCCTGFACGGESRCVIQIN